jgi:branched-chain amino acid transport system ATP-binding protein
VLELKNVTVSYGPVVAVKNVSLKVEKSSITTILGANGSGKTSLLHAIVGLNKIVSGEILFEGERIDKFEAHEIVRRGLILCPDNRMVFQKMTVLENLQAGAYLRRDDLSKDFEFVFTLFPKLKERLKQKAGTLSGGERQMLAIARALMAKPKLLMLDEPSTGLAPNLVTEIMRAIKRINESGVTILLVEQSAYAALKISHYGYVLQTGRLVMEGPSERLIRDSSVVESYLGGEMSVSEQIDPRSFNGKFLFSCSDGYRTDIQSHWFDELRVRQHGDVHGLRHLHLRFSGSGSLVGPGSDSACEHAVRIRCGTFHLETFAQAFPWIDADSDLWHTDDLRGLGDTDMGNTVQIVTRTHSWQAPHLQR